MLTSRSRRHLLAGVASIALFPGTTLAADLPFFTSPPPIQVPPSSNFTFELFTGYLVGSVEQNAFNCCGEKFAHTRWKISDAGIVGATVSYRWNSFDLRLSGWTLAWSGVSSESYTDAIVCDRGCRTRLNWRNDKAKLPRMYQIDASVGYNFYENAGFILTGLAGYRYLRVGLNEIGGLVEPSGVLGDLSALPMSSAYDLWWHTPYVGLGAAYDGGSYRLMAEIIASPFAIGGDRARMNNVTADASFIYHTSFLSKADYQTWMAGATLGGEIRLADQIFLTGKAQYQYYEPDRSKSAIQGICCGAVPATQSGELSALTLTVGLKAFF